MVEVAERIERQIRSLAPGRVRTAVWMGWRPDLPDYRDYRYAKVNPDKVTLIGRLELPTRATDIRVAKHPVFDQGPRGSCTRQSTALHHAIERNVTPRSALFLYWKARETIGETHLDEGAYIRDAIKACNIEGAPRDDLFPDEDANLFRDPPTKAETDAERRKVFTYFRLNDGEDYRACLASGHGFVIGFTVYENFWQTGYNGGLAPMPGGRPDGGHAVFVYGYDNDFRNSFKGKALANAGRDVPERVYLVRNSWGMEWGDGGNFYIPQAFLDHPDLADDAWTLRKK